MVERDAFNLEVLPQGPTDFFRTMFDLIVLAFETDTTRVAAYQMCAEDGVGICDRFPSILGSGSGHHGISHGDLLPWGSYDRYVAEQFTSFLSRLAAIRVGESRLLDNTVVLHGSGTRSTHNARNYPLIPAGGANLGLHHGRFIKHQQERPLGDQFVTLLHRFDVPIASFADNASEFNELPARD